MRIVLLLSLSNKFQIQICNMDKLDKKTAINQFYLCYSGSPLQDTPMFNAIDDFCVSVMASS